MKKTIVKLAIFCVSLAITSLTLVCLTDARIPSGDIVGIWLLDEGKGDEVRDASGGRHHGEIKGEAIWADGKFGDALEFDGNTMVEVPDDGALRLGKEQTITVWLNPSEGVGDWARLVGKGGNAGADLRNYGLWREANGWLLYQIFDGADWGNAWQSGNAATEAPLGKWTHLAGTYDGTNVKLYVNGEAVFSAAYSKEPAKPEDPLTFGYTGYIHTYFKGLLDDIGIFNAPLSDGEIKEIMNDGLGAAGGFAVSSEGKLAATWGEIKE